MQYSKHLFSILLLATLTLATSLSQSQDKEKKHVKKNDVQAPLVSPEQKGIALGLYSEDPGWSYVDMIREMKAVGADHIAIVVPYYIKTDKDYTIYKHPRFTVPMHTLERTIDDAKKEGLKIFLFPILRVEDKSNGGWRGSLAPSNVEAFFKNYTEFILKFAKLAEEKDAAILAVGSELNTMDVKAHTHRWKKIIAAVKQVYKGKLTYSANWDHYEEVKFWSDLDFAGVTGYFELSEKEKAPKEDPPLEKLIESWRYYYMKLIRWQFTVKRPLILTEVGYLSQKGTAARPWNEGADEDLDLEIQRRCYEAFIRVWAGEKRLAGAYFWNWFGWGGKDSKEYTPRNKPAAREISKWYSPTPKKP